MLVVKYILVIAMSNLCQEKAESPKSVDLYNTWHFYEEGSSDSNLCDAQNASLWATEAEFSWASDVSEIEQTLWNEGVVKLGTVSDVYLGSFGTIDCFSFRCHIN